MRLFRIMPVVICLEMAHIPSYWAQMHPVASTEPVLLIESARLAISRDDFALAFIFADQAVAEAPQSAQSLYLRGKALSGKRNYKSAADDFFKAHSLFNQSAKATFAIYQEKSSAGREADAAGTLSRYVELTKAAAAAMDELAVADAEVARPFLQGSARETMRATPSDDVVAEHSRPTTTW